MPTPTYRPLANITLGSTAGSVTFSSIPNTYRDLVVVINGNVSSATDIAYRLNGDSASNYSNVWMFGDASSSGSGSNATTEGVVHYTNQSSQFLTTFSLIDYSATNKHKMGISRGSTVGGLSIAYASRWANTAAVTTLLCIAKGTTFTSGTTFALYGIAS
jgi:hypothetical protein